MFYAYQKLIRLRKAHPIFTWGDYHDLLAEHPYLWCYRREWQGQTLVVMANLSREAHWCTPGDFSGAWQVLMSNYPDAAPRPGEMNLRPFEAVIWLQGNA
ncbi:Trehalose-6-phosphate hydrolase [Cronobacter malonaticus 507]|nr:Trehalose-6-phosphate hydrolase [Cronobacter malonaticus 507]